MTQATTSKTHCINQTRSRRPVTVSPPKVCTLIHFPRITSIHIPNAFILTGFASRESLAALQNCATNRLPQLGVAQLLFHTTILSLPGKRFGTKGGIPHGAQSDFQQNQTHSRSSSLNQVPSTPASRSICFLRSIANPLFQTFFFSFQPHKAHKV